MRGSPPTTRRRALLAVGRPMFARVVRRSRSGSSSLEAAVAARTAVRRAAQAVASTACQVRDSAWAKAEPRPGGGRVARQRYGPEPSGRAVTVAPRLQRRRRWCRRRLLRRWWRWRRPSAVADNSGGGAGGSGFGPAGATVFETGVREGNGVVSITFDPDAGTCSTTTTTAAPTTTTAAEAVAVTASPRFTG